jgi:peptide-methionine (S)-S-oxide reductase
MVQTAIFGGGCFWCIDAAFRRVKGVCGVSSGYSGGQLKNPTYHDICTGQSGHAEVIKIDFDNQQVSYSTLLQMFFDLHDATQLNRQGNDVGTQYRSVIFYCDSTQKVAAQKMMATQQQLVSEPIVTELSPEQPFYNAEQYHQDYFVQNPQQPYCSYLIAPKLAKFYEHYQNLLV